MNISRRGFTRNLSLAAAAAATWRPAEAQTGNVFPHGIASGDPLIDRVIIWTRVTRTTASDPVSVEWVVAEDPGMMSVRLRGVTSTSAQFDYTVKVDVPRLDPGTTYYYQFFALNSASPIGRTRTLPLGSLDRLRLAVTSCSNYPFGFFNVYRLIANRNDLDAVLHLGDYIYEYANGGYGGGPGLDGDGTAIGRIPAPNKETIALEDYRTRYAQYRSDPDLQEAHRQHPWIIVWDDHEVANDAWLEGAENHTTATEGSFSARRAVANKAWFEWMPVRENPFLEENIYRTFRFGNLVDLVMLDTRLAGRSQQVAANSPAVADPSRTLMGQEQEAWFYQQLSTSKSRGTRWRLIGQQTMMGHLFNTDGTPFNTDQWDGYVASRNRFLSYAATNTIDNMVVLTGDIHTSWGNEIAANPFAPGYTPQAVEFVTPAVTSPSITDNRAVADGLQAQILSTHPHVKYVELLLRGYLLVDITRDRAQAEWYHVPNILTRNVNENVGRVLAAASGSNRLVVSSASSSPTNGAPKAP